MRVITLVARRELLRRRGFRRFIDGVGRVERRVRGGDRDFHHRRVRGGATAGKKIRKL